MVNRVGGGIFAKTAKTPPLQSAFAGISLRVALRFWSAKRNIHHDAARRVATFFEKWDCLIETYLRIRRGNPPKRLNSYRPFAAVSLWNTAV